MNMLLKYAELTGQKVAKKTKAYSAAQLKTFDGVRCPPLLYITGQRNISLGNNDIKILQEYINDKHGMIFGDNGGSRHFHNQFISMMQRILSDVRPVEFPRTIQFILVPIKSHASLMWHPMVAKKLWVGLKMDAG